MDPFSAMLFVGIVLVIGGHTVGSAVTDAAAAVRGQTPPSLEKWRARRNGQTRPGGEPNPWRRRWDNAVAVHTVKAATKHAARMQHLDATRDQRTQRHLERLQARARRFDAINNRVAALGTGGWEAAKKAGAAALSAAAVPAGRHAAGARTDENGPMVGGMGGMTAEQFVGQWSDNPHGPDDATDLDPVGAGAGDVAPDDGHSPESDPAEDTTAPQTSGTAAAEQENLTTERENTEMSAPTNTTATEITDLDTAISYSTETAKYAEQVSAYLADTLAQLDAATSGLATEAAQYEQAKASLSGEGFGEKVTGRFDAAAESLNTAAAAVKGVVAAITEASEQVAAAGGEMRGAVKVFSDQQALAEQIGAHRQDAGVASTTAFYSA